MVRLSNFVLPGSWATLSRGQSVNGVGGGQRDDGTCKHVAPERARAHRWLRRFEPRNREEGSGAKAGLTLG